MLKEKSEINEKKDLIDEAVYINSIKHKNLIGIYGIGYDYTDPICIVLEYADLGDLLAYLRANRCTSVRVQDL